MVGEEPIGEEELVRRRTWGVGVEGEGDGRGGVAGRRLREG